MDKKILRITPVRMVLMSEDNLELRTQFPENPNNYYVGLVTGG
jgi:hypothetical protein